MPADPLCSRQSDERPQGLEFGHLLRLGFCLRLDALGAAAGAVATLGPAGVVAGAGATGSDPLTPSQRHPCRRCHPDSSWRTLGSFSGPGAVVATGVGAGTSWCRAGMSGSNRTKNRLPVQASRWAVSQHYSGREDLRVPADSVTRTHQQLSLKIIYEVTNSTLTLGASLSIVAWRFRKRNRFLGAAALGRI